MKKKSVRLPEHIKPERYKLMIKPDLEGFTFEGEETVYLSLGKDTREIVLHADELEIEDAKFTHSNRETHAGKISLDKKTETVKFTFPKTLLRGKGELSLKFKGILNNKNRGFYRSRYVVDGQERYLATSQLEATDARRVFPCVDEPAAKAVFDVTLMIPGHTTAVSNTLESSVSEHESGLKIVEFVPTPKMSTYLLAFIVGEFEYMEGKTKNGVLVRVFVTPGKKHQTKFALDTAIKILEFYEDYFKIKYPLPVLDLIAIPDFYSGAMENWGAVTYRETAILVDPEHSSKANKQWVALVIAHELAHQWFGDLVTMEWWTHLWLNEGFASYIEYLAVDHIFPEWDIWTQFVFMEQGQALELDSLSNTHPIEIEVHHPGEINEIFDRVSYEKGASILRMLAEYLGYKDFRNGLRHYLQKHQYANATTYDLWKALEEVSGKPVAEIMSNWTAKAGYPLITVEDKKEGLKLKQSRFFSSRLSDGKSKDKTIWNVPLVVRSAKKTNKYLINKKYVSMEKLNSGQLFKANLDENSFIRVSYPEHFIASLKQAVETKTLATVDRLGLLRDVFALSESEKVSATQALDLALSYKDEEDYSVWATLASGLDRLENLIAEESFYENFRRYGRELWIGVVKKLGWKKVSGEKHTDTLLRSLALYRLGNFGDQETVHQAFEAFDKHLAGKKVEADLRGVVYNLVAENGGKKQYQTFKSMYMDESLQEEQMRIARAMSKFKQPDLIRDLLDFSLSKHVRVQDSATFLIFVLANHLTKKIGWEFLQENWQEYKKRYEGGHRLQNVVSSLETLVTVSDARKVQSFFKKYPAAEAKRGVAQAVEQILSNADWLKRDRKSIERFLQKFAK